MLAWYMLPSCVRLSSVCPFVNKWLVVKEFLMRGHIGSRWIFHSGQNLMACGSQVLRNLCFAGVLPSQLSKPAAGRFGIERHPYTKSRIGQIPCVCVNR